MMDFVKTLSNPVVLAGGAALGLVLLMMNRGTTGGTPNSAGMFTVVSDVYNQAALASQDKQLSSFVELTKAKYAAQSQLGVAGIDGDVRTSLGILSFLGNNSKNASQVANQSIISSAGVAQGVLSNQHSVATDNTMQMIRLALGNTQAAVDQYGLRVKGQTDALNSNNAVQIANRNGLTSVAVAQANGNAQVAVAQAQANALKSASHSSMWASLGHDLIGGISTVAKMVL
jgi:hypothetical protein